MINELISVIIPVYNNEKYLNKCIESVANQTYKNLEIILVDDGSTDDSSGICDEWAEKDSRVKVIHKVNTGVSDSRNTALNIAEGDYITFVDSDDCIDKDCVEAMLNAAEKTQSDIAVSDFYFDFTDGNSKALKSEYCVYNKSELVKSYLLDKIRPEACAKLIKKSVIADIMFDINVHYAEDFLFNYFVLKKVNKLVNIGEPKYHYLQESGNSSTTAMITHNRAQGYKVFERVLIDCAEEQELYSAAVWRFTVAVFAILTRVMQDDEFLNEYFDTISNCIIMYKKDILLNKYVGLKHKLAVMLLSFSKRLYIKVFKKMI